MTKKFTDFFLHKVENKIPKIAKFDICYKTFDKTISISPT